MTQDIYKTLEEMNDFSVFLEATKVAGIDNLLKSPGPLTVFAPTDSAFRKVPKEQFDYLRNHIKQLKDVLMNHIITGYCNTKELCKIINCKTIDGRQLDIRVTRDAETHIFVNDIPLRETNIEVLNGIIHSIGSVLFLEK